MLDSGNNGEMGAAQTLDVTHVHDFGAEGYDLLKVVSGDVRYEVLA